METRQAFCMACASYRMNLIKGVQQYDNSQGRFELILRMV